MWSTGGEVPAGASGGGATVQCARPRGRAVLSPGGEGPAGASGGRATVQCARPRGVTLGLGTTCRVSPSQLGASELTTLTLILGATHFTPVGGWLREEGGLRPTSQLQVGDRHLGQGWPHSPDTAQLGLGVRAGPPHRNTAQLGAAPEGPSSDPLTD